METRMVVDTCIVDDAFLLQEDDELQRLCVKVILRIADHNDLKWVIDEAEDIKSGPAILNEYRNHLGGVRDFEIFWMQIVEREKIVYVKKLCDKEIDKKLDEIGFHEPEDRTFLYTALAADKEIVTEDSDYGVAKGREEYKSRYVYFTKDLGMIICDAKAFDERYNNS